MRDLLLKRLSAHKNLIFLIMCLGVHLLNAVLFFILKLYPLMFLNILSTVFYLCMLSLYKKESDKEIVLIYLEILLFSAFSDIAIGGIYDYIFFIVGMVSVITYLLSETSKHRHLAQGLGAVLAIAVFICRIKNICLFPETAIMAFHYNVFFKTYNLVITIFTLVYVSGLYTIELALTKEKLNYASNHDALTGLYNRRFLEHALKEKIEHNTDCFSIAMFDIDNFKKINDTYGHDAGDKVLQTVSNCFEKYLITDQLAIRWGGEEFILYFPKKTIEETLQTVSQICEDIRNSEINLQEKGNIHVTVTAGIASGNDILQYESVIKTADDRLYVGKQNGKNRIISE